MLWRSGETDFCGGDFEGDLDLVRLAVAFLVYFSDGNISS